MKKFLKMLKHNAGLKLLAFVFAVGLWLYVLNVEDPEITRSFTVDVSFENEDTLTELDKNYEVLNDSDTIRVTVSAQRSIIEELTSSDFTAVADLDDLSDDQMDGTQDLEVYVSLNRYSGKTTIVSDTRYTTISIEDELTSTFEVTAETTGTPANGYAVGSLEVLPESVSISGVTSLVEQVASAAVTVDVSGMESSMKVSGNVVFYDENGNTVDMSDISVDYSAVTVYVECDVVKTIELLFSEYGTPANGYRTGDITASVTEISVQGEADAVEDLTYLRISGEALDVTDAKEDVTVTIDPADYLPYGVSMSGEDVTIEVTIEIVEYDTVTVQISTDSIVVEDLEDGYTAEFEADYVYVSLSVPASISGSISTSTVTLTADLNNRSEGTYYITLKADLPDGWYLNSSPSATVVISAPDEENDTQ